MVVARKYSPEKIGSQFDLYVSSAAIHLYDNRNPKKVRHFLKTAYAKLDVIGWNMNETDFFAFGEVREMENRLNMLEKDLIKLEVENE
jgi:hypothetical protein